MIAESHPGAVLKPLFLNVILTLSLLAGCTSTATLPERPADFTASGKLAVKDGDRGHSARFVWRQWGDVFAVEVWGPLGQGRSRLSGNKQHLQVERRGEIVAAGAVRQVMLQQLGWALPVEVLPAWLQGQALSGRAATREVRDEQHRLIELQQAGWQVSFSRYRGNVAAGGVQTPSKIVAIKEGIRITMLVREFSR